MWDYVTSLQCISNLLVFLDIYLAPSIIFLTPGRRFSRHFKKFKPCLLIIHGFQALIIRIFLSCANTNSCANINSPNNTPDCK